MALRQSDFEFIRKLIQERAAIVLDDNKHYFVESRLAPLVQELEMKSIEDLVRSLQGAGKKDLRQRVTEAITIHETSFFRDLHPFKALKETILPELIANRTSKKSLSLWCGASSSGQEPYTITMILKEHFPQLKDWRLSFIATDISNKILNKAKDGTYSQLEINRVWTLHPPHLGVTDTLLSSLTITLRPRKRGVLHLTCQRVAKFPSDFLFLSIFSKFWFLVLG